tara:strand:- start:720 stop:899 length:180 start_codon:yes stop_codon:yes gene_type:complete
MTNKKMSIELERALNLIWSTVDQCRAEFYQSEEWAEESKEIGRAMNLIEHELTGLHYDK